MKRIITFALLIFALAVESSAQNLIAHPWEGKRVAYFGDSITDPRNKATSKKYWGWLQDMLGITPYVYGISGRQWDNIPSQTDKLQQEHGDEVDAIMIFCGTNDFNNSTPLGEWYEVETQKVEFAHGQPKTLVDRQHRTMTMDSKTLRGRINIALDKLKKTYPTKQIVLLTPIHRAGFYPNEKNWQPTEDYSNSLGLFISDYVDVIKEAGNVWAVPVIDLNALCGLYPMADEHAQYFNDAATDRLHPNNKGHERMAKTLVQQLLALPVF